METWENCFKLIQNSGIVMQYFHPPYQILTIVLFTEEEVEGMIASLKQQKVAGPDGL
jgi:hypothetical protein